jgi:hypothetical protein
VLDKLGKIGYNILKARFSKIENITRTVFGSGLDKQEKGESPERRSYRRTEGNPDRADSQTIPMSVLL